MQQIDFWSFLPSKLTPYKYTKFGSDDSIEQLLIPTTVFTAFNDFGIAHIKQNNVSVQGILVRGMSSKYLL